jgi:uncharacterized protein (TIGR03437 family)
MSDMSLVRPENPALQGEPVAILSTGLGLTSPALETGRTAASAPVYSTAPVSVTVGGRTATVVGAGAVPGFLGQYLVVAQIPSGISGTQPLMLRMGETSSNTVQIPVR